MAAKLNNSRLLPVYAGAWLAIAVVHFAVVENNLQPGLMLAATEAVVFSLVFALLGIGLWFLVKLSDAGNHATREMLLRHFTSAALTILLWFGSSYLIMTFVSGGNEIYMQQLYDTIVVRIISGVLLYITMISFFYLVINNQNLQERRVREEILQQLLHESELNSLRSQIKPHFLFNSLNSISSLTITNPEKAQEMVINLSEFMRYSLSFTDKKSCRFDQELHHLRLYLDIEKVRFGGRLQVDEQIDTEAGLWEIPPVILQPLVENAVKHGVYDTPGISNVLIKASIVAGWLEVSILNNYDPDMPGKAGTGTGLSNVRKRMQMVYGIPDLVKIEKSETTFQVRIKFPPYEKNDHTDH